MSSFSDYLENAVLNHVFRNTSLSSPTTVYVALYTAAPTDAGGGTEASGNGYARQAITFGAPSGGVITSNSAASFTAVGGGFGTIVAVGYFNALTGGNLLAWDTVAPAAIGSGDTFIIQAGQATITLT